MSETHASPPRRAGLTEDDARRLEALTVDLLLATRAEYLRTPQANVLEHWTILETRLRIAARSEGSAEALWTTARRMLQLPAPSRASSVCFDALVSEARDLGAGAAYPALVEARVALLLARARVRADERRAADAAADLPTTTEED